MSAIGDLVATMGMNIAPWQSSLARAGGSLTAFQTRTQATITRIRGAMGGMVGMFGLSLSVAGLTAATRASLNLMDTAGKLADRLGMTTERLQGLRHAADIAGGGAEAMSTALEKMTRYVGEAALGMKEQRDTLENLGLPLKTLLAMNPDDRFAEIAEAIRRLRTEEERTAVGMRIFGRGASELLNTILLGKKGLAEMQIEAERLGLTFSREAAAKAEEANDAITRLGAAIKGSTLGVVSDLAVEIKDVADAIATWPQAMRDARAALLELEKPGTLGHDLLENPVVAFKRRALPELAAKQGDMGDNSALVKTIEQEQARLRAGLPLDDSAQLAANHERNAAASVAAAQAAALDRLQATGGTIQEYIAGPFGQMLQRATARAFGGAHTAITETVGSYKNRQDLLKRGRELAAMVETPQEEFVRRMGELAALRGGALPAISAENANRLEERYRTELNERLGTEVADTFAELPGVLEKGSNQAWSKIIQAMYTPEKQDANEKVADNTQRAAAALERIEAREVDKFFEIGV